MGRGENLLVGRHSHTSGRRRSFSRVEQRDLGEAITFEKFKRMIKSKAKKPRWEEQLLFTRSDLQDLIEEVGVRIRPEADAYHLFLERVYPAGSKVEVIQMSESAQSFSPSRCPTPGSTGEITGYSNSLPGVDYPKMIVEWDDSRFSMDVILSEDRVRISREMEVSYKE